MRLLFPVALAIAAGGAALPAIAPRLPCIGAQFGAGCPSASSHFAREGSIWHVDPSSRRNLPSFRRPTPLLRFISSMNGAAWCRCFIGTSVSIERRSANQGRN